MKTRASLQTHPSVLLMWLSCHSKDTRKGQSERWLCDQSSMPAVPLVSMQERGRREGGVGRGGEVEGGSATSTSSHPEPLIHPLVPPSSHPGSVQKGSGSSGHKDSSIPRLTKAALFEPLPLAATQPAALGLRAQLLLCKGFQSEPHPASEPAHTHTSLCCRSQLLEILLHVFLTLFFQDTDGEPNKSLHEQPTRSRWNLFFWYKMQTPLQSYLCILFSCQANG